MNTVEKRNANLRRADQIRIARAAKKREVGQMPYLAGRKEVAKILLRPGDLWENAKVEYILKMPRSSGQQLFAKACDRVRIDPGAKVADLFGAERLALAVFLCPDAVIDLAVAA